jgi:hypothetical protein
MAQRVQEQDGREDHPGIEGCEFGPEIEPVGKVEDERAEKHVDGQNAFRENV